jgi:protein ImuA
MTPTATHTGRHSSAPPDETTFSGARAERLAALRRTVARLESGSPDAAPAYLSLGLPEVHGHLPGPGLPCGALHEVLAMSHGDRPAAFGFVAALAARALSARRGAAVLVAARRCFADFGQVHGPGLRALGFDPGQLLLVETRNDTDALWAMEESLRPEAAPAVVAGAIEGRLDLTMSRRLNLAAAASGTPLLLLRSPAAAGTSAAVTRWRVAAAPAGRDRFGALAGAHWQVALERCRNGRGGQWLIGWDHVADRFHLAEVVADRAPAEGAGPKGPSSRGVGRLQLAS